MRYVTGRSASPGIAIGVAYVYAKTPLSIPEKKPNSIAEEQQRIADAFRIAQQELEQLRKHVSGNLGDELAHIFRAQLTMTEDEDLRDSIRTQVIAEGFSAEQALSAACDEYTQLFSSLGEDDYNKQRLSDLQDVCHRLLRILLGVPEVNLAQVPEHAIILAEDLLPSDTATMDRQHIEGLIVQKGGITSHVAILAKSLGIPASVGTDLDLHTITDGQKVILDTRDTEVAHIYIDPDRETEQRYRDSWTQYLQDQVQLEQMRGVPAVTTDGKTIQLSANVGSPDDLNLVRDQQISSIGLLRTEFFFLQSSQLPTEEQQFVFYRDAVTTAHDLVVIRTLDIGGDKQISSFSLPIEDNPFLGLRGVRVSLRYPEILKTQLRAMLRAATYGKLCIMVPMIADVSELRAVKTLCEQCREELEAQHIPYSHDVPIGLMAETPASVLLADVLSREGDFVSIGTNDLTQYLLSADRTNAEVSTYYRVYSPAVFRAIHTICDQVHLQDKWVGICGELGGNIKAIPALIGLGVDELSMSARTVASATRLIRSLSYQQCKEIAQQVLQCTTEEEVLACLTDMHQ
jgi:phosphotransferase system enzyme I (PtsI)